MKKNKLKKYSTGSNYIEPDYTQQSTGRGIGAANGLINGLSTAGTVGGQAIQSNAVNSSGVNSTNYTLGGIAKGAGMGASMGASLGPIGLIAGTVIGGIAGGLSSSTKAKSINATAANNKRINNFIANQNQYSAQDIKQVGYAKKGLDMTKSKLKKYPGGTSGIKNPNLPQFTAAENEQLTPLRGTPQYKQAVHNAIGYTPKYINPIPGSQQATYEDSTFNAKVRAFNKRDLTKSPANFGNALQQYDANRIQNNLNYNAQNQKLDTYEANYGGAQLPNNLSISNQPGQMPNALRKFAKGSKGIHINPANKGKFPGGTSGINPDTQIKLSPEEQERLKSIPQGTTEHRQAIWDILGYSPQPYPVNSLGYKKQEDHFNSAVNLINQGYRPAISPAGKKGYQKVYGQGSNNLINSKLVEVEKDEIIMKKKGNRFVPVADFKGGKLHSEGGEMYEAHEGEIIYPKNKRKEVVEALKEGDNQELERIRKTLPKDKNYKMKKGTYGINYGDSSIDTEIPYSGDIQPVQIKSGSGYTPLTLRKIAPVKTSPDKTVKNSKVNLTGETALNAASNLGEIAPIAYNISQGLSPAVQTTRRNFNPKNYIYQDLSQPLRNEVNSLYAQDKQLIRNASGGNAGTYLANVGLASANKFKRLQEINNNEAARKIGVQNQNTELSNNTQMANLELNNQYDQLDLMNKGAKQGMIATGLGQLSQYAQQKSLDRKLTKNDEEIINNLESKDYKIDHKTGKAIFKNKKGNRGIKLKKMKSM